MHSHIGVDSLPGLHGADDTNSLKGITQPWLRSLDGLNTHDAAYKLTVSGGVTTALILPGSAGAIGVYDFFFCHPMIRKTYLIVTGGQAFVIKLRDTAEGSPTSKVLEPPHTLNGTRVDPSLPPRWRHMKFVPSRSLLIYYLKLVSSLDTLAEKTRAECTKAHASTQSGLSAMPTTKLARLRSNRMLTARRLWQESGKVSNTVFLRICNGKPWLTCFAAASRLVNANYSPTFRSTYWNWNVQVNIHCYEAVDFDGIVRLTNEFQFPIAAYHHAHEAYLVPDLLRKTYGGTPAIAMFAGNAR